MMYTFYDKRHSLPTNTVVRALRTAAVCARQSTSTRNEVRRKKPISIVRTTAYTLLYLERTHSDYNVIRCVPVRVHDGKERRMRLFAHSSGSSSPSSFFFFIYDRFHSISKIDINSLLKRRIAYVEYRGSTVVIRIKIRLEDTFHGDVDFYTPIHPCAVVISVVKSC